MKKIYYILGIIGTVAIIWAGVVFSIRGFGEPATGRSSFSEPPGQYGEVSQEALQTKGSWKIDFVYNTKHGVKLKYDASYCAEIWPQTEEQSIWHCRKSEEDAEFVLMDSWVNHNLSFEYGALFGYGAPTEYDPDEDGWAEFLDPNVENGKRYLYRIIQRQKDGTYTASYTETMYWLERPKIEQAQMEDGTISLCWTENTSADGYEVQYTVGDEKKRSIIKDSTQTEMIVSDLEAGEICEIRVRSWKSVDGETYYSAGSKGKKIKVV